MIAVKVTTPDGNHWTTSFNGTLNEAENYFLNNPDGFNIGQPHDPTQDNVVFPCKVELI